jgi:hypothetical protein
VKLRVLTGYILGVACLDLLHIMVAADWIEPPARLPAPGSPPSYPRPHRSRPTYRPLEGHARRTYTQASCTKFNLRSRTSATYTTNQGLRRRQLKVGWHEESCACYSIRSAAYTVYMLVNHHHYKPCMTAMAADRIEPPASLDPSHAAWPPPACLPGWCGWRWSSLGEFVT